MGCVSPHEAGIAWLGEDLMEWTLEAGLGPRVRILNSSSVFEEIKDLFPITFNYVYVYVCVGVCT